MLAGMADWGKANPIDGKSRAVYTVKFAGAVYVLHAFQKKSKKGVKTPKAELDLIRKRLQAAEEHYGEWRATQEDKEGDEDGAGSRGQ
jgi:hypothetical protein